MIPQWLLMAVLAALLIGMAEAGYRGQRLLARRRREPVAEAAEGGMFLVSAALALLGLLIAFTFSMAATRFDERRDWVSKEANAIGTAYLRARIGAPDDQGALAAAWASYATIRAALPAAGDDADRIAAAYRDAGQLQSRIWRLTEREARRTGGPLAASLVDATNTAFDVAESRRAALEQRVPAGVIASLVIYAVLTSALLGQSLAQEGRRRALASGVLLALMALAISLVIDLDHPRTGSIRVSQAPMDRLVTSIRAMERIDVAR